MTEPAPPAATLNDMLDQQIAELVASESGAARPADAISAPDMSPLEAAVLSMSHDLSETLRLALQLQEQGRALEPLARALTADMAEVRAAIRSMKT